MHKKLAIALALTLISVAAMAADPVRFITEPQQRLDARYRLFRTENVWTLLELDTQTGRLWQVQFSVSGNASRLKKAINDQALAADGKSGRFTLYPTGNNWNFLLVDQDSGQIWQAQFSMTDEERMIVPIGSTESAALPLEAPRKLK